jgi:hypothetical protein
VISAVSESVCSQSLKIPESKKKCHLVGGSIALQNTSAKEMSVEKSITSGFSCSFSDRV